MISLLDLVLKYFFAKMLEKCKFISFVQMKHHAKRILYLCPDFLPIERIAHVLTRHRF